MDTKKTASTFSELAKNIHVINLPFSRKCGDNFEVIEKVDTELYKYFPPLYPDNKEYGWHLVGKVSDNSKYTALLSVNTYADYAIPYILTFTRDGRPITKLELYKLGCAEEETYYSEAIFTISKELLISMSDSSSTYRRDNVGAIIKKSIKSTSASYRYQLNSDGTISLALRQNSN